MCAARPSATPSSHHPTPEMLKPAIYMSVFERGVKGAGKGCVFKLDKYKSRFLCSNGPRVYPILG